jgi:hypothetical protein
MQMVDGISKRADKEISSRVCTITIFLSSLFFVVSPLSTQQQLKKIGIIIHYLDQFNRKKNLHTPRAQGQTALQSEPLERAALLPGLSPGYVWLCSHTTVASKYALSKVGPALLALYETVSPLDCLLLVRPGWLEASKSPVYLRCPPSPPNYTLPNSSHCPAIPPSLAPADALSPSVVPPFIEWLASL